VLLRLLRLNIVTVTYYDRLEGKELPYNAFAFRLDRNVGQGMLDKCILYRARATVVNLADCAPGVPWGPTPTPVVVQELLRKRKWEDDQQQKHNSAESVGAGTGDQAGSTGTVEAATMVSTDVHADTQDSAAREKVEPVDTEGQHTDKRHKHQHHHQAAPGHSSEGEARAAAQDNDDVDDGQDEDFTLTRLVFVHSRWKRSQQRSPHTSTSPVLVLFVALTCVTLLCAGPTEPQQRGETPPRWCCPRTQRCQRCALSWWATASCAAWCAYSR
jgi:hypothetical protein